MNVLVKSCVPLTESMDTVVQREWAVGSGMEHGGVLDGGTLGDSLHKHGREGVPGLQD